MPCFGSDDDYKRMNESSRIQASLNNTRLRREVKELEQKLLHASRHEAAFCALMSEIESAYTNECSILNEAVDLHHFCEEVSKKHKIDIKQIWNAHKARDEDRLEREMKDKFSEHEISTIREMFRRGLL